MNINLMVTTNQKPAKDTQRIKRKEPRENTKENQQTSRDEIKRRKDKRRTIKITTTKQQNCNKYILINHFCF